METIQDLHLELIKRVWFNECEGKKIYKDLVENRDLWISCMMTREDHHHGWIPNLIALRDMKDDYYNVDTLFILVKDKNDKRILELTKKWDADTASYLNDDANKMALGTSHPEGSVLKIWWD
jgi:hypothetical protein